MQHNERRFNTINGTMIDPPTTAPTPKNIMISSEHPNAQQIAYKVSFYNSSGETIAGPASERINLSSDKSVKLFNVPTSPHSSVIGRVIYRGRSNYYIVGKIEDNISTEFVDNVSVGDISEPLASTTDTFHNVFGYMRQNRPMMSVDPVKEVWASPQCTQAGARVLYYGDNQIVRSTCNGDSVKLPIACLMDRGMVLNVLNKTPFVINVYPADGQKIDNDGINICVQLNPKSSMQFRMEQERWRRIL